MRWFRKRGAEKEPSGTAEAVQKPAPAPPANKPKVISGGQSQKAAAGSSRRRRAGLPVIQGDRYVFRKMTDIDWQVMNWLEKKERKEAKKEHRSYRAFSSITTEYGLTVKFAGDKVWCHLSYIDEHGGFKLPAGGVEHLQIYAGAPPPRPAEHPQEGMGDDLNTKVKQAKAEILALAKPRPKPRSSTLQLATYRALLQNVDLLNPDLGEDERRRRAKRLVKAYGRVRERRPRFHDRNEQLQAAFSIVNRDQYQRTGKPKREAAKLAIG
jgi:hypothetical protein